MFVEAVACPLPLAWAGVPLGFVPPCPPEGVLHAPSVKASKMAQLVGFGAHAAERTLALEGFKEDVADRVMVWDHTTVAALPGSCRTKKKPD